MVVAASCDGDDVVDVDLVGFAFEAAEVAGWSVAFDDLAAEPLVERYAFWLPLYLPCCRRSLVSRALRGSVPGLVPVAPPATGMPRSLRRSPGRVAVDVVGGVCVGSPSLMILLMRRASFSRVVWA